MSEQMSFVYVQATGHVLAVATLVAAAKTTPAAMDLASPSLIVRNFTGEPTARFDLTPDVLAVFTGDPQDAALADPRGYCWDAGTKQIQSLPNPTAPTVTLKASSVDVDLNQVSAGPTKILVAYAGTDPSKSELASGQVASGSKTTSVSTGPLVGGAYVLVLATGFPPAVKK